MTIQELIEVLNNVEDKSREIYIADEGFLISTCLDHGTNMFILVGKND